VLAICYKTLDNSSTTHLFDQCLFNRPEARDLVDACDAFGQCPGRQTNYGKKDEDACRDEDATATACEPGSSPAFAAAFCRWYQCGLPPTSARGTEGTHLRR